MFRIKKYGVVKAMSHSDPVLKIARDEVGVSKHVPITHFNSETVLESKNGALFSVIKLSGVPFDTEKTEVLNNYKRAWHRAITTLDERFAVLGTINRRKENCSLDSKFTNAFAKQVDDAYQEQFKNASMYTNEIYLAVIYKGVTTGKVSWFTRLFNKVSGRYIKEARESRRAYNMKQLNEALFQLKTSLSQFGPHIVGSDDQSLGYSELLSYVSLFVNGAEALKFKGMKYSAPIETTFENSLRAQSLYPNGNIAQYISAKQIFTHKKH